MDLCPQGRRGDHRLAGDYRPDGREGEPPRDARRGYGHYRAEAGRGGTRQGKGADSYNFV